MRVRDHIALSTAGAGLLLPALGRKALVPWAASILIDIDHLMWYCAHERSLSPLAAIRYFNQAQPPQSPQTRMLHMPWSLAFAAALGGRWRFVRLLVPGLIFHVALDGYHEIRMRRAKRAALRRDSATCQSCGARGGDIVAHKWRQPWLFPSYRAECFVSLCSACHEKAHTYGTAHIVPDLPLIGRVSLSKRAGASNHAP